LILKIVEEKCKIAYSDLHTKEFKNLGYTQEKSIPSLTYSSPIALNIFISTKSKKRRQKR